jgi:hypothetical protein
MTLRQAPFACFVYFAVCSLTIDGRGRQLLSTKGRCQVRGESVATKKREDSPNDVPAGSTAKYTKYTKYIGMRKNDRAPGSFRVFRVFRGLLFNDRRKGTSAALDENGINAETRRTARFSIRGHFKMSAELSARDFCFENREIHEIHEKRLQHVALAADGCRRSADSLVRANPGKGQ